MLKFTDRTSGDVYSDVGKGLNLRIKRLVYFYQSFNEEAVVSKSRSKSSYKPGVHKFPDEFIKHYMTKKDFRESLVVSLATVYVEKFEGIPNPPYGAKVLIFFLSLCVGGSKESLEFVSRN